MKQHNNRRASLFTLAALVVVLICNVYVGRAQTEIDPEAIWNINSPVGFDFQKFSPDDKFFFVRNDGGIYKFNAENGEYMGLFISGLIIDFVMIEEYGWMICALEKDISIFDLNTGSFIRKIGDAWPGNWMDVSPDKTKFAFRQLENILVYSLPNFEEICRINHPDTGAPRFVGNDRIVVTHGYYMYDEGNYPFYAIDLYSADDGKFIKTLASPHPGGVGNIIYVSPDQKYIISTGSSRVNFYDVETGDLVKNIPFSQPYLFDFSPNNDFFIICNSSKISIYNANNREEILKLAPSKYRFAQFLNNDNHHLLAGKFNNIKMLYFDFDSLLTDVKKEENFACNIYPNPATDFFTFNSPSIKRWQGGVLELNENFSVEIYDVMGMKIHSTNLSPALSEGEGVRIDVSNLAPGVYFVKISGSNGACSIVNKFVKM